MSAGGKVFSLPTRTPIFIIVSLKFNSELTVTEVRVILRNLGTKLN